MRNKKNIKRKKKLNTPKPSVFAVMGETEEGGGWKMCPSPPHTLSRALSLSATGQVFFYLPSSSQRDAASSSDELFAARRHSCQTRHSGWLHGGKLLHRDTQSGAGNTSGWQRERKAQLRAHLLTRSLARSPPPPTEGGRGGRKGDRQTDRERVRDRCGGGSLCRIVN